MPNSSSVDREQWRLANFNAAALATSTEIIHRSTIHYALVTGDAVVSLVYSSAIPTPNHFKGAMESKEASLWKTYALRGKVESTLRRRV